MSDPTPLTVGEVVSLLRRIAPNELAESWDSNRLICGDPADPVRTVLLAVDPLPAVVDEAIETGVDMVITHHPLFLRGTDHVSATSSKGRSVHRLIRAGIALANAHTSWDSAAGGVADALAAAVGLTQTVVLSPSEADPELGIGRVGDLEEPTTLRAFAQTVAEALPESVPGLLVGGDLDAQVSRIAVSGGSGDSLLGAARAAGADVFLTADLRHHPATDHLAEGRPYLLCGTHWATEWVGLPPLAQRLETDAAAQGRRLTAQVSRVVTDAWTLRLSTGA
ncbi:Nif3-like dinuclear metal center hexameric protein [Actinomyces faecalis]|uniref:Nif3-like dinuclear metal center hexameric protein n=1 Tax=Actinomyces faecalis TaxID=2722820 RepID=UPI001557ADF9|nr:Nif3-like dinuclear metal center hexameric protein [Actinomyces faecalis]